VPLCVGTKVEARYYYAFGGRRWFSGEVARVQDNGLYVVHYRDGDKETDVQRHNIRTSDDKICANAGHAALLLWAARPQKAAHNTDSTPPVHTISNMTSQAAAVSNADNGCRAEAIGAAAVGVRGTPLRQARGASHEDEDVLMDLPLTQLRQATRETTQAASATTSTRGEMCDDDLKFTERREVLRMRQHQHNLTQTNGISSKDDSADASANQALGS
jgi:hypothetical protein